jgi:hypothetical protein
LPLLGRLEREHDKHLTRGKQLPITFFVHQKHPRRKKPPASKVTTATATAFFTTDSRG